MLPGVYAILVFDPTAHPEPFRAVYFGQAEDLSARVVRSHEKYSEWTRAAGGAQLHVAYYLMPNSNEPQRCAVEQGLISHYSPECNDKFNPWVRRALKY